MQHEVGIRRGTGARFVLPGSQQRGLRSGSLRLFPARSPQGRDARATQPLRAIQLAARSVVPATPPARQRSVVLGASDLTHWNAPRSRLRDPRSGATPWRG